MYAVIKTGGKQYKVTEGTTIRVEKLAAPEGGTYEFDQVLMIADGSNIKLGNPILTGGKVTANIKAHGRGEKIEIVKFRRRKHYRKQMGHRQYYTEVQITGISA